MSLLGAAGAGLIRTWLRLVGRRVRKSEVPWLVGPVGGRGRIGRELYQAVAAQEGLAISAASDHGGLLPRFDALDGPSFDSSRVRPEICRFYEQTARYRIDVWSETVFPSRIFLWLLVNTVSRSMEQLNFPVFPLEVSRGMASDVIPLTDPATGGVKYTGWLRTLRASGRVLYAGFYATARPPVHDGPCVKVVFPVPRGSATVLLRPEAGPDGSLRLVSSGSGFGAPGFYRILDDGPDHLRVRYLRSLRELFHVYRDEDGVLRTDHRVQFLGLTVLRLHYRMT
jgi:hypothetical protein